MPFITQLKEINSIQIVDTIESWKDAIYLCFNPLLNKQYITAEYIQHTITKGEKFGFYYLISPGIALPHSRPKDGVLKSGTSLLIIKKGVFFENHHFNPVYCVIGLAAQDSKSHISTMMDIATTFGNDEGIIDKLRQFSSPKEVLIFFTNKKPPSKNWILTSRTVKKKTLE